MKNNRAKRRAFMWKHLLVFRNFGKPYMQRHSKMPEKQKSRFDIAFYRRVIIGIEAEADNGIGFPARRGERGACMTKGVWYEYGNMTFKICGLHYGGVKKGKLS